MRAYAQAWLRTAIVQVRLAQLPLYHHLALLDKLDAAADRLWYAGKGAELGCSRRRNQISPKGSLRIHISSTSSRRTMMQMSRAVAVRTGNRNTERRTVGGQASNRGDECDAASRA